MIKKKRKVLPSKKIKARDNSWLLNILNRIEIEESIVEEMKGREKEILSLLRKWVASKTPPLTPHEFGKAIYLLGLFRDDSAADALARLIKHKEERIRVYAIRALGRIGSKKTLDTLTSVIGSQSVGLSEKMAALSYLDKIGDERTVKLLQEFLDNEDIPPEIREKTRTVLFELNRNIDLKNDS